MKNWLNRWGHKRLNTETPVSRERKGQGLHVNSRLGLLVPAADAAQRKQLKDLVAGLEAIEGLDWQLVADTGLTRRAHAKARAQRIQKLGDGQDIPADFPQLSRVHCFWRDDCGALGLPTEVPAFVDAVDVLITLDAKSTELPLKAMMRRSRAPFKVGPVQEEEDTLDFMLTWPEEGDMLSFFQLAFHYLKTLDLK